MIGAILSLFLGLPTMNVAISTAYVQGEMWMQADVAHFLISGFLLGNPVLQSNCYVPGEAHNDLTPPCVTIDSTP